MAMFAMLACINITSCSDDDDDKGGERKPVNDERKLRNMYATDDDGSMWWHFDNPAWDNGRLVSFENIEGSYTINYYGSNKARIDDCEITLDSQGYAIIVEDGTSTSMLTYNKDGRLTEYDCDNDPEGGNEKYKVTINYNADGDITSTEDPYDGVCQFAYTNTSTANPIENKGGAMIMEMLDLGVLDSDYYYFGIYGKGVKHLPVKIGTATLDWTLDDKGYPATCVVNDSEDWETPKITYHWIWE